MKKLFAILVIILAFMSIKAFAADHNRDMSEIKQVLSSASELRESMGWAFRWYDGGKSWTTGLANAEYVYSERLVGYERLYIKVQEGYAPNEVRVKISNVFSERLSNTIIDSNSAFFDNYYYFEGNWYYFYDFGSQILTYDSLPTIYFSNTDIEEANITFQDNNHAQVTIRGNVNPVGDLRGNDTYKRKQQCEVVVSLEKTENVWKINDYSNEQMIFSVKNTDLEGNFSKTIAINEIKAIVFDLYYYSTFSPVSQLDTSGIISKSIKENGVWLRKMEGNLSNKNTWIEYGTKFATSSFVDEMLSFKTGLIIIDECVYYKYDYSNKYNEPGIFAFEKITDEKITITSQSENFAAVSFSFELDKSNTITLRFEFTKEDNQWKISGGDFLNVLNEEFEINTNPSTGDNHIISIVLMIGIVLLSATLIKKRYFYTD